MTYLTFQSCYVGESTEDRFVNTHQNESARPDEVLSAHASDLATMLATDAKSTANPPGPAVFSTPTPKVDTYIGTDGIRHTTITTQKPGESEQDWQSRHDAAAALMRAAFPAAS